MKKELVKDFPKNLIHRMVEQDSAGWPPHCATFAYQPVRPCKKRPEQPRRTCGGGQVRNWVSQRPAQ